MPQALTQVAPINAAELATIWILEKALAEWRGSDYPHRRRGESYLDGRSDAALLRAGRVGGLAA